MIINKKKHTLPQNYYVYNIIYNAKTKEMLLSETQETLRARQEGEASRTLQSENIIIQ